MGLVRNVVPLLVCSYKAPRVCECVFRNHENSERGHRLNIVRPAFTGPRHNILKEWFVCDLSQNLSCQLFLNLAAP